jgi:hypothetical protein
MLNPTLLLQAPGLLHNWTGPLRFMTAQYYMQAISIQSGPSQEAATQCRLLYNRINHYPAHKWRDRVDRDKVDKDTELSRPSSQLQLPPPKTATLHTTCDHECSHIHDRLVCKHFQHHVAMSSQSGQPTHSQKLSVGLHSDLA